MNKQIKAHRNFSQADYDHLRAKGYTNREVLALWNNKRQTAPQPYRQMFNVVGYV